MTWSRALVWMALFALVAAVASGVRLPGTGGGEGGFAATPGGRALARVERVVDGDTVVVRVGGRRERVRYIGMDTPETVKPSTPVQCWGPRAHDDNARLVAGRDVLLRFDRETRDRYGRLLAYVYRRSDGLFVDAQLVRLGDARTLTIPPNTAHEGELARLQTAARTAGRGLWGACL
jgi:micrococcal nuclease